MWLNEWTKLCWNNVEKLHISSKAGNPYMQMCSGALLWYGLWNTLFHFIWKKYVSVKIFAVTASWKIKSLNELLPYDLSHKVCTVKSS